MSWAWRSDLVAGDYHMNNEYTGTSKFAVARRFTVLAALLASLASYPGCVSELLPANIGNPMAPAGLVIERTDKATLSRVLDDDVYWLDVERQSDDGGTVGGFISPRHEHDGGLVMFLDGASTFAEGGELEAARLNYHLFSDDICGAGFMMWVPVLPEEDTPFGGEDLNHALELIDWLDAGGKEFLRVERIYVVGYSAGGTIANLINLRRDVTAIVSLASLTHSDQLDEMTPIYRAFESLFPDNTGARYIDATIRSLEPPDSEKRQQMDVVAQVEHLRNPTLFVHGMDDIIFFAENTLALEARYWELLAEGVQMPELDFLYMPGEDHFQIGADPYVRAQVVDYLLQFESPGF